MGSACCPGAGRTPPDTPALPRAGEPADRTFGPPFVGCQRVFFICDKARVVTLFGGGAVVTEWVKACGSDGSFCREMFWCADLLGGHWRFTRTQKTHDWQWGEGLPPGLDLDAL